MANDRMYIVCTVCNEGTMLVKRMGRAWYTNGTDGFTAKLDCFFDEHYLCFPEIDGDLNHYKIAFENTDDFKVWEPVRA